MDFSLHDEFWFKVKIESAKDVYGVQCQIVYPPEILEAVLDEAGNLKSQIGSFLTQGNTPALLSAALEDDKQGKIVVGYSKMGKAATGSGTGSLFDILFRCVGNGRGEIRFEQAQIYDAAVKEQPSQWIPASIEVLGINVVSAEIVPRSRKLRALETTLRVA